MSDNLLLLVGIGVAAVWWLGKDKKAMSPMPGYSQPPPLVPAPGSPPPLVPSPSDSQGEMNTYWENRFADEASQGIGRAFGHAAALAPGVDFGDMGPALDT